jgi:hypothetical protein
MKFGWYPNLVIALRTRTFVFSLIRGLFAITRETVEGATFASCATSFIVMAMHFPSPFLAFIDFILKKGEYQ